MKKSYKDASTALEYAIQNLSKAYDAATNCDDKNSIFTTMEILQDEVDAIAKANLSTSDSRYQALMDSFKNSAIQPGQFKKKIDQYIDDIELAGSLADSLTQVISLLT
ncbi:hypothetical protein [Ferrovum myxofaciens]|uniref:hypothetical protein n=1 Tax=Ferrovum myxofaciens TaxID=416213 RepID=UPI003EBF0AC4